MPTIHTPSAQQVSKLRKAAKLLVRSDASLSHAQALDTVAKTAGFHHWKHLIEMAGNAAPPATPSARSLMQAQAFRPVPKQTFTILQGRSGSGKSFRAMEVILDAIRESQPVAILDYGLSFSKLVHVLDGVEVTFDNEGRPSNKFQGGNSTLQLFEFDGTRSSPALRRHWSQLPDGTSRYEGTLLVVDEVHSIDGLFENLPALLEAHIACGGSVLVLMQDPQDSRFFARYAGIATGDQVFRRTIQLSYLNRPKPTLLTSEPVGAAGA